MCCQDQKASRYLIQNMQTVGGKKKKIYPEVHKELSLKKYTNTDSTAQTPKWANQFLTK